MNVSPKRFFFLTVLVVAGFVVAWVVLLGVRPFSIPDPFGSQHDVVRLDAEQPSESDAQTNASFTTAGDVIYVSISVDSVTPSCRGGVPHLRIRTEEPLSVDAVIRLSPKMLLLAEDGGRYYTNAGEALRAEVGEAATVVDVALPAKIEAIEYDVLGMSIWAAGPNHSLLTNALEFVDRADLTCL